MAMQGAKNPAEIIENLFLRTFPAGPRPRNWNISPLTFESRRRSSPRLRRRLWALLNSSEFAFNH